MSKPDFARLTSIGSFLPSKKVSNDDLSHALETSDEWIYTRTGIHSRHLCEEGQSLTDMATEAALKSLKTSDLQAENLDHILCATVTPDMLLPSAAVIVQRNIGAMNAAALDTVSACAGFIYNLHLAKNLVIAGASKNTMILGAEKMSSIVNWEDRTTCVLFGDAAGAGIVTEAQAGDNGIILDTLIASDPSSYEILTVPGGGSNLRPESPEFHWTKAKVHMNGQEVFKNAVKRITQSIGIILERNDRKAADIDKFIIHQANARIIESIQRRYKLSDEQVIYDMEDTGNTSAASIPLTLDRAIQRGEVEKGQKLCMAAMGAGFCWAASLVDW